MRKLKIRLVRGIMCFWALFPLGFHYFWADIIAWLLDHVIHYRKEVVLVNLARAFPEKKPGELKRIASDFYCHMAEIIVEAIWFGNSDLERLRKANIVSQKNIEVLAEAYENSPSVAVLYSHCGNWELLGGFMAYNYNKQVESPINGKNTFVVYRKLRNEVWDEVFKMNRIAPMPGFEGLLESSMVLRHCIKHRDSKNLYHFAMDQSPYVASHDVGIFLNQPTKAMMGGIGVAHKLGMSVLYMKMVRTRRGHYDVEYVPICSDASKVDAMDIMRKYYDLLEEEIKATPANWLWSHKRWK